MTKIEQFFTDHPEIAETNAMQAKPLDLARFDGTKYHGAVAERAKVSALLAECKRQREQIAELRKALEALVAADACNYQRDTMRSEGMFDKARAALDKESA